MTNPRIFSRYFVIFQNKNVHPVFGVGIWTHDLQNMRLLS